MPVDPSTVTVEPAGAGAAALAKPAAHSASLGATAAGVAAATGLLASAVALVPGGGINRPPRLAGGPAPGSVWFGWAFMWSVGGGLYAGDVGLYSGLVGGELVGWGLCSIGCGWGGGCTSPV